MKKIFYIFLAITKNCANITNSSSVKSECKKYDRVYEYFALTRLEKIELELLFENSEEKYVYYSEAYDFFYPNATKSEIAQMKKTIQDENNAQYYYYDQSKNSQDTQESKSTDISSSIDNNDSISCESSDKNHEILSQKLKIKSLTMKNLRFHLMALKSHSLKKANKIS